MQKPAPKGVNPILVDQIGKQAEEKIAGQLNQMGQPATRQSVSPDHSHVLEGITKLGGAILHDARAGLEELKEGETYIRTTDSSKVPTDLVFGRQKKGGRIASLLHKLWK